MSAFLAQFQPDPEFGRRLWRAPKPLLRAAVVTVAPPYPEYPTLTVNESVGSADDPSSPSAREVGSDVAVSLYEDSGNGSGSLQERAWEYILAHPAAVEAALRRKLFAWHGKRMAQFRDEELPHDPEYQAYWKVVEEQVALGEPAAVDHLFKLVGVGLADSGLDECGVHVVRVPGRVGPGPRPGPPDAQGPGAGGRGDGRDDLRVRVAGGGEGGAGVRPGRRRLRTRKPVAGDAPPPGVGSRRTARRI
ncbi:hypothetical protein [Urbifossiella limnaea]|uniref:Uncharacterized protein n=1 Tax=Urbifossiella limnaea TaxID=2528023 RepID=A0A517XW61_9BACT|nr:hypothetical protein [Urbifossiella limnaea]QDU21752.1 hypothetical protein ETAA1_37250 [Urbifossiella limnaea]